MKLSTLAFKSLSKSFANKLKKQVGLQPNFCHIIIGLAQANHRLTTTIQGRIYGHATDVALRPLNEERAIQAGSELNEPCITNHRLTTTIHGRIYGHATDVAIRPLNEERAVQAAS